MEGSYYYEKNTTINFGHNVLCGFLFLLYLTKLIEWRKQKLD